MLSHLGSVAQLANRTGSEGEMERARQNGLYSIGAGAGQDKDRQSESNASYIYIYIYIYNYNLVVSKLEKIFEHNIMYKQRVRILPEFSAAEGRLLE